MESERRSNQRFSKRSRLTAAADFARLKKAGRRRSSPHFVLLQRANTISESRLGLAVSRKVAPSVGRNQLKRRLRELFRRELFPVAPVVATEVTNSVPFYVARDYLVIAKMGAAELSFSQLRDEIRGLVEGERR